MVSEDLGYWERWLSIFLWMLVRKIDKLRQQQERKNEKDRLRGDGLSIFFVDVGEKNRQAKTLR